MVSVDLMLLDISEAMTKDQDYWRICNSQENALISMRLRFRQHNVYLAAAIKCKLNCRVHQHFSPFILPTAPNHFICDPTLIHNAVHSTWFLHWPPSTTCHLSACFPHSHLSPLLSHQPYFGSKNLSCSLLNNSFIVMALMTPSTNYCMQESMALTALWCLVVGDVDVIKPFSSVLQFLLLPFWWFCSFLILMVRKHCHLVQSQDVVSNNSVCFELVLVSSFISCTNIPILLLFLPLLCVSTVGTIYWVSFSSTAVAMLEHPD